MRLVELGFFVSLIPPFALFLLYPGMLYLLGRRRASSASAPSELPRISFVIVARNAGNVIAAKVGNVLSLDYPGERLEILVADDGSTDGTADTVNNIRSDRVKLLRNPRHRGKNAAFNDAAAAATGEVIVLSDADSLLQSDSLIELVKPLASPDVGGVSGRIVVQSDRRDIAASQSVYWSFDRLIKTLESRLGFLTSNTGALCALRRDLFEPVPDGVTDDLFMALTVIGRRRQFLFAPEARTTIRPPSTGFGHEVLRRRRIVSQSLRGIYLKRELLDPRRAGLFSLCLFTNKVLRRLLPVSFMAIFISSAVLAPQESTFAFILLPQVLFYSAPVLLLLPPADVYVLKWLRKIASLALYFISGNTGTLLGLLDFMSGKTAVRWEPASSPPS